MSTARPLPSTLRLFGGPARPCAVGARPSAWKGRSRRPSQRAARPPARYGRDSSKPPKPPNCAPRFSKVATEGRWRCRIRLAEAGAEMRKRSPSRKGNAPTGTPRHRRFREVELVPPGGWLNHTGGTDRDNGFPPPGCSARPRRAAAFETASPRDKADTPAGAQKPMGTRGTAGTEAGKPTLERPPKGLCCSHFQLTNLEQWDQRIPCLFRRLALRTPHPAFVLVSRHPLKMD